jgi:hypothetical protein
MKSRKTSPAPRLGNQTRIVVDPKDPRTATVVRDRQVIFSIRTDESGVNPSIVVMAMQTHLKSMEKGKAGIVLWNGRMGVGTRNLKLY